MTMSDGKVKEAPWNVERTARSLRACTTRTAWRAARQTEWKAIWSATEGRWEAILGQMSKGIQSEAMNPPGGGDDAELEEEGDGWEG